MTPKRRVPRRNCCCCSCCFSCFFAARIMPVSKQCLWLCAYVCVCEYQCELRGWASPQFLSTERCHVHCEPGIEWIGWGWLFGCLVAWWLVKQLAFSISYWFSWLYVCVSVCVSVWPSVDSARRAGSMNGGAVKGCLAYTCNYLKCLADRQLRW